MVLPVLARTVFRGLFRVRPRKKRLRQGGIERHATRQRALRARDRVILAHLYDQYDEIVDYINDANDALLAFETTIGLTDVFIQEWFYTTRPPPVEIDPFGVFIGAPGDYYHLKYHKLYRQLVPSPDIKGTVVLEQGVAKANTRVQRHLCAVQNTTSGRWHAIAQVTEDSYFLIRQYNEQKLEDDVAEMFNNYWRGWYNDVIKAAQFLLFTVQQRINIIPKEVLP